MALSDPTPSTPAPGGGPRRLARSRTDRMIAGVCGGVAAYSGIDVNVVRLIFVALTLFGGSGVLLYLIAWVLLPEAPA